MNFTLLVDGKPVANIIGRITGDKDVISEFGGKLSSDIVYSALIDKKIIVAMRMEGTPEKKYEITDSDVAREIEPKNCKKLGPNYILTFYGKG